MTTAYLRLTRSFLMRPIGVGLISQAAFTFNSKVNCASSSNAIENPLLKQNGLPRFAEIQSAHIVPAVEHDLNKLKEEFNDLEKVLKNPQQAESWVTRRVEYDYPGVIEKLEAVQSPLSYSWSVVGHLMGVKNSEDLRTAHKQLQPTVVEAYQKLGQSKPLFHALDALKRRKFIWESLDAAQKRIVDSSLRSMKFSGVDLSPADREKFNKLQLEAAELSTKFSNNVLDSTKAFKLKLTKPEEVEGLPSSAKALAVQAAKNLLKETGVESTEEITEESGPWVITLDLPSYLPAMQHLKDRSIRESLYKAYVTRASEGEHDNAPIIQRILQIKLEMAKLLGFSTFAEKSLASKMAPDVAAVNNLIEMLREKSYPAAERELQELREFAKQEGATEELQLWDISFWSERMREKLYQYEEEELRAYFPLPRVLDGLFTLAKRLFGVEIVQVTQEGNEPVQLWHEDVSFYHVLDEKTKEHIASFYLDPYSRPAEKRGGAWMDVCIGKSKVLGRKVPVAYLICNGSPPVKDAEGKTIQTPSLMTFREVETLFHEFGHGLQHMLTRIEHADAAGINNIEWDAVELPSQFMENWCYDLKTINSFAEHYQTKAPLPAELFQKIKAAKNYQAGMQMIRQLYFGATDMFLHSQYDPYNKEITPFQVQQELAKKYTVVPPLPQDRFLCSFGHIFAGGYSAGYYSYKWAEVMSADAFAAFEEAAGEDLSNEEAIHSTGRRFRETVLALGGGQHPSEVYKAFRGRDPSPDALLRHSGLLKVSA